MGSLLNPQLTEAEMASSKRRGLPLMGVLLAAVVLVAAVTVLLGASGEDSTLAPRDSDAMRKNVDKYWSAIQHSWPAEYRSNNQKKLPQTLKDSMRAARKATSEEIVTGDLAVWEENFDPAGFLEEMRASGTVVTGTGYEIRSMSEPVLVSRDVAQADFTVVTWSEQYEVDSQGTVVGEPYRTENESIYRYTFERFGGKWRISVQDLISNPL